MIISCNNCNKKFDVNSNLIPDNGRLLQCADCDYKWFFKKEIIKNTISPIDKDVVYDRVDVFDQSNPINKVEINPSNLSMEETEVDIEEESDKEVESYINEDTSVIIKKKNFKILNIFIVAIISFVAFIIIVDTFKYPIGKIVPNIEFILYNLYESIKDISLFIRDLT